MNGTVSEVEEEVVRLIEEHGPLNFQELREKTEFYPNDLLFGIVQSDMLAVDDSGRYILRSNE